MAAVSTTVHHLSESRVKIQEQSDDEPFSPSSDRPTSPPYQEEEKIEAEPRHIHSSPFSIHNVLKKERDSNSPDANVFSTEKLLQNTPCYESDGKPTDFNDDPSPNGCDSRERTPSPRYDDNSAEDDNPSYVNPDSVRADINVEDDGSCCSEDTVLSVGNEAPLSNFNSSAESTSKSTPNSPGTPPSAQSLTSFKHIQTHLNAISQLSQNINMNQPLLLRPNPITPNPLLFLNQPHLLFQNPLLNQVDSLKTGISQVSRTASMPQNLAPTSPSNPFSSLNQFGVRNLKQNGLSQNAPHEIARNRPDENRRSFLTPKSDDESRRDLILNQNCLKFSIDNILKADFGRRITDPLIKRKIHKPRPSFESPKAKEVQKQEQQELRVPDVKTGDKGVAIDLSKADEGGSSSSQGSTAGSTGDGPMVWPAWVYCTRYSDRPSSGPRTRRPKKPPGDTGPTDEKRPRTAFSGPQLARLKHEFAENRYLTERRRQALAAELGLAEAQIKIWFQNKRAKIKKASGQRNPLALQLMAQGLYNHSTVPLTREEEELEMQAREREKQNRQ